MKFIVQDAALRSGLEPEKIERFILFTWVRPADPDEGLLDECDLARCRLIAELQDEFGVNDASVPVILDLIDQLHDVRNALRLLK